MKKALAIIFSLTAMGFCAKAQEKFAPVNYNPHLWNQPVKPLMKTTTVSLPFFEDFTNGGSFPDPVKWTDRAVYVNNTMGIDPVSRGVATFDALNYQGAPYDSFNNLTYRYADSLTSQLFDLSTQTPADSIYLSFFYQPKGNGFAPETQDSLMLYLKKSNNAWVKVWSRADSALQPFRQAMIAVTDTAYFHSSFQFRFVNKASIVETDDMWHLDYIRFAANRNMNDTAVYDIAATYQPSVLLNDYTSMPYRQFTANANNEWAVQHSFTTQNRYNNSRSVVYGYYARERISNTSIFSGTSATDNLPAYSSKTYSFPSYTVNYSTQGIYDRVVIETRYFAGDPTAVEPKENDTIVSELVFDNYLAYDDGTAEKVYYLEQGATLPAKTALEFHLNQPDTLQGVAIYFGRQVPLAFNNFFTVAVYKNITVGAYFDTSIYEQEFLIPGYVDTINHFWVYKFDTAVALPAGTFFVGTTQPAQSSTGPLYFGFDVNRLGGNHLYINATGTWEESMAAGALMIRPLLGKPVFSTDVETPAAHNRETGWKVYPNPARDFITLKTETDRPFSFEIRDAQGRLWQEAVTASSKAVDISALPAGIYFVRIFAEGQKSVPQKIIKL